MSTTIEDQNTEWKGVLSLLEKDEESKRLLPVVSLAARDEILKELHPYTSHLILGFSRSKAYPFSQDMPFVTAREDGTFEVLTAKKEQLAIGTAEKALAVVKAINACKNDPGDSKAQEQTATSLPPERQVVVDASLSAKRQALIEAMSFVSILVILERDIRCAYKVRKYLTPKRLFFKALPRKKQRRLESLLKLRDAVVHGDEKAARSITPDVIREVQELSKDVIGTTHNAVIRKNATSRAVRRAPIHREKSTQNRRTRIR